MSPQQTLPIIIIACNVFQELIDTIVLEGEAEEIIYMDYGLHRVPDQLRRALQEAIDAIEAPSLIVLGYGLCGNGLDGLRSGEHTLIVPRTDDCIAILLGSYKAYMHEFEKSPGTYYLTKGWLESGSHPLKEYHEVAEKYGADDAAWIMDSQYQNYERLLFVAHTDQDLVDYREQALEVARFCERWQFRYEEKLGSDAYIRKLIQAAQDVRQGKSLSESEFVIARPGEVFSQSSFMH